MVEAEPHVVLESAAVPGAHDRHPASLSRWRLADCDVLRDDQDDDDVPRLTSCSDETEALLRDVSARIIAWMRKAERPDCPVTPWSSNADAISAALHSSPGDDAHLPALPLPSPSSLTLAPTEPPIREPSSSKSQPSTPTSRPPVLNSRPSQPRLPPAEVLGEVLRRSVNPHTHRFLDKLYTAPTPEGIATELTLAALNANVHVMSASPWLTLVERRCVEALSALLGWTATPPKAAESAGCSSGPDAEDDPPDGLTMPGGSASNTLALQTALANSFPSFPSRGLWGAMSDAAQHLARSVDGGGSGSGGGGGCTGDAASSTPSAPSLPFARLLVFTSEQSHYSIDKAAIACGLGLDAVVKVPCDAHGRMDVAALDRMMRDARRKGDEGVRGFPFFVNATSGTTVLGSFDDLEACAAACARQPHPVWLHVDASWGGPVIFSDRWRHLMRGVQRADSLAINPHKLLQVPLQCSFALFRRGSHLDANYLCADYLFHSQVASATRGDDAKLAEASIQESRRQLQGQHRQRRLENPATKAYGCGRRGDALKLYVAWQHRGLRGLGAGVDRAVRLAHAVREVVARAHAEKLELGPGAEPCFVQVCFRPRLPEWVLEGQRVAALDKQDQEQHQRRLHRDVASEATRHVHAALRAQRRFAVDFAPLPGDVGDFLRLVTHADASEADLEELVAEVAKMGAAYFLQLQAEQGNGCP